MSGKGDDRRPEAIRGAYAKGFEGIDWTARAREQAATDLVTTGTGVFKVDPGARVPSNVVNCVPSAELYREE